MAIAIPPFPEPSSFVTVSPVRPTACLNSLACTRARYCPSYRIDDQQTFMSLAIIVSATS